MTRYKEAGERTIKEEYEEIGWSVFDSSIIYKVRTTIFSIADGIIEEKIWYVNEDGTKYKARTYRNHSNGFTEIYQ